ncbi:MAG TPA: hypothetical protein VFS06_08720 [Casimicrobiaceae bacterium]|nr:hypothetical protein [Casimicrobiaceae bacterium]
MKTAGLVLILLAVAGLAAFNLFDVTRAAPAFGELVAHDEVLQSPVQMQSTGRRSIRGRYAVFDMDEERATVEEVCDVWDCRLPSPVKALHRGDHLTVWTAGHRIWQLNHEGELLLEYRQAVDAHRRASVRKEWIVGGLLVAMLGALAYVLVRRQRRRELAGVSGDRLRVSFRVKGNARIRLHSSVPGHLLDPAALARFEEAAKRRDRDAMVRALVEAGLSETSAGHAADALLGDSRNLPH